MLEGVAGGFAFRASRDAADACARLFERPVERGLSQAALETLAIVAYLGPCSRPDIARIRGVAADSAVASLLERGLIGEAGREPGQGGAVRYRTTPALRARVRPREPRRATSARRPRRGCGRAPRAAARGRGSARVLGRGQICQAPFRRTGTVSPSRVMPSTASSGLPIMKSTCTTLWLTRAFSVGASTGCS